MDSSHLHLNLPALRRIVLKLRSDWDDVVGALNAIPRLRAYLAAQRPTPNAGGCMRGLLVATSAAAQLQIATAPSPAWWSSVQHGRICQVAKYLFTQFKVLDQALTELQAQRPIPQDPIDDDDRVELYKLVILGRYDEAQALLESEIEEYREFLWVWYPEFFHDDPAVVGIEDN